MCDGDINPGIVETGAVSRRGFVAGAAAIAGVASIAAVENVVERDVSVKTADGMADAVLLTPAGKGKWPAALIWVDIFGLRPVFREMGRRLAAQGYVVLVPNCYYRVKKAPVIEGAVDFNKPDDRARLMALRNGLTDVRIDGDAHAYLAFLDSQPQTDTRRKAGVQGYCMGGPLAFRTAAAVPGRIGAVGSFHGGGLTTKEANSPHLLIPKTRAAFLVAIAQNDDQQQPESKTILKQAFAAAKRPATVEVYPADHGWCVPGGNAYNQAAAEKAWAELSRLYKANLG